MRQPLCHAFLSDNNLQRACVAEGGNFDWLFKETVRGRIRGCPPRQSLHFRLTGVTVVGVTACTFTAYDEALQRVRPKWCAAVQYGGMMKRCRGLNLYTRSSNSPLLSPAWSPGDEGPPPAPPGEFPRK